MSEVIEPKVRIIDYGPKYFFSETKKITPDEFVYAAANITYKDVGALQEFMELKESETDLESKVRKMLIRVAGAGHASMATTPGFWIFLEGNCSKLVDSIFTGARFASSLMPSGRRVPIDISQIVIPKKIAERGENAERIYLETSENNIKVYEEMQKRGVPKQEASKIVQYGHRGGGFMFMPLETFIYFARLIEENSIAMPEEGKSIIFQLEKQMKEIGMNITYTARKDAPRTGAINPNIFHCRKNLAGELMEQIFTSTLIQANSIPSADRDSRIIEYLESRRETFSEPNLIKDDWKSSLMELDNIVSDFNDSVSAVVATPTPWRIWGEVKRHRTLSQTSESIYKAAMRAFDLIESGITNLNDFNRICSIPSSVHNNPLNLLDWTKAFEQSIRAYVDLIDLGIPMSDAIAVVPRGLKLGVIKKFDLYNLTLGYMSLRLCESAEPEMRRITEHERKLIINSQNIPKPVKTLIDPKCIYTGFCPEDNFCSKICKAVPKYNEEMHKEFSKERKSIIESKLL